VKVIAEIAAAHRIDSRKRGSDRVLQAGQQPRIDRLLLIEMEKRDTGVGAQHIVARERQGAGVQIADQQRRQQSNTKRAAVPDGPQKDG
jgi:hypothetical protein